MFLVSCFAKIGQNCQVVKFLGRFGSKVLKKGNHFYYWQIGIEMSVFLNHSGLPMNWTMIRWIFWEKTSKFIEQTDRFYQLKLDLFSRHRKWLNTPYFNGDARKKAGKPLHIEGHDSFEIFHSFLSRNLHISIAIY